MKINSVSNNQNFGVRLPLMADRINWWKLWQFPQADEVFALNLTKHMHTIGSPKSKIQDWDICLYDADNGQKELFTAIRLKVGSLFDRSSERETLSQISSEPFTLEHLKYAFSTMVAKIERGYIKSRTFLAAGKRIQEGKPLALNKDFKADLKKIDKAIPGYADFKRKLYDVVTSAEGLIR